MVINQLQHGIGKVLMAPNRSASWRTNKLMIAAVGSVTLLVGGAWTYIGAWVILPFAGLEVSLLAYALYRVSRDTLRHEVLYVEPRQLRLETGIESPSRNWVFEREHAYFRLVTPRHELSGANVYLCSAGQQIELGAFLSPEDKHQLISALRSTAIVIKRTDGDTPGFHA